MTFSRESEQAEQAEAESEEQAQEPLPERPQRQPRPPRPRPEMNPALDPRLVQLERRALRPSRAGDISLMVIGLVAFAFGVAMYYWIATSILDSGDSGATSNTIAATATPVGGANNVTVTPTVAPKATATPLPDRTSCDEIRGTQYRSVAEREFFLANCTAG